eukprot:6740112-Pyramimonas_sp.AAC.1
MLNRVGVDGVGGSRRIADASAMRPDVEPDVLHADAAKASPTSSIHGRCICDASAMYRRCGAILRPHLLGLHLGGL